MSLATPPTGFPVQVLGCYSAEDDSETVCAETAGYNVCYRQTHQPGGKGGKGSPHTLTPSPSLSQLYNDVRTSPLEVNKNL